MQCHSGTGTPANKFSVGDASNLYGNNQVANKETSHNWSSPSTNLAAGADEPLRIDGQMGFFSRYGTTMGLIACSRCHNPHGQVENNPKLLTGKAYGFTSDPMLANDMCIACHAEWNQENNDGWLTHPLVPDYSASVLAEPEKYKAILDKKDNSSIQLVNGGVSCSSCHGVHYVDSDATTVDGPAELLSKSDGKLLRGDGPNSSDKTSLCQTCHTYAEHGDNTGEKVGCLVCHSGHSYDLTAPNYYVLRKATRTTSYNSVSGLDYSSPSVLLEAQKYTFWNDQTDGTAEGYCEKCHGDAVTIGAGAGNYHVASAVCTDCHSHSGTTGASFSADCDACHAYPPAWQSHPKHFYPAVTASTPSCSTCHKTSVHLNGLSEVRFDSGDWMVSSGSYSGTDPSRYTQASGYNPTTPAYGSCDNIYCHSNAQPDGGIGAPQTLTNPNWGDSNVSNCGYCHKGGVHADTGPRIDSGSHSAHLDYGFTTMNTPDNPIKCTACHTANTVPPKTGSLAFNCSGCHSPHNPDTIFPLFQAMHIDGEVTINLHSVFGNGAYDGTPAPGDGYGSCDDLYCHSVGDDSVTSGQLPAIYSSSQHANPEWGTGTLGCNSCHGRSTANGMPDYTNGGAGSENANSHPEHVASNQRGCNECHYQTTNDGSSITSKVLHVNLVNTDVSFDALNPDAMYNAPKTCGNSYCHSDGTTVSTGFYTPEIPVNTTPAWGTAGDGFACDDCHGYPPDYGNYDPKANTHSRHNYGWLGCEGCHYTTTTDGVTITNFANHINGSYDVSPSPTFDRGAVSGPNTFTYTFDAGGGTCDSISCHAGLIAADKKWGNSSLSANFSFGFGGCYEVTVTASTPTCNPAAACSAPYTYIWDFGDGTIINGSNQETHSYGGTGSWDITLTVISSTGLSGSRTIPNITIDNTVVFNNNDEPVYDDPPGAVSVSNNGLEVTLTDLHKDPDFSCYVAEYGDGLIKIDWGPGGYIDYPITLSENPSNQTFIYTYASPGTYTIRYGIQDNVMTWPNFLPNFQVTVP